MTWVANLFFEVLYFSYCLLSHSQLFWLFPWFLFVGLLYRRKTRPPFHAVGFVNVGKKVVCLILRTYQHRRGCASIHVLFSHVHTFFYSSSPSLFPCRQSLFKWLRVWVFAALQQPKLIHRNEVAISGKSTSLHCICWPFITPSDRSKRSIQWCLLMGHNIF